jgi:hypothetical protein
MASTRIYDKAWALLTDERCADLKADPHRALTAREIARLQGRLVIAPRAEWVGETTNPPATPVPEVLITNFIAYIESL